jgi:competence ComEA-like helix-hairpin-helix protein
MKRTGLTARARFFFSVFACAALLMIFGSCAKLPRQSLAFNNQNSLPALLNENADSARTVHDSPRININTASATELEKLPGIGKGLAARIIAHREQYGRFRRAEHLLIVSGISETRFKAMRELITVE